MKMTARDVHLTVHPTVRMRLFIFPMGLFNFALAAIIDSVTRDIKKKRERIKNEEK